MLPCRELIGTHTREPKPESGSPPMADARMPVLYPWACDGLSRVQDIRRFLDITLGGITQRKSLTPLRQGWAGSGRCEGEWGGGWGARERLSLLRISINSEMNVLAEKGCDRGLTGLRTLVEK